MTMIKRFKRPSFLLVLTFVLAALLVFSGCRKTSTEKDDDGIGFMVNLLGNSDFTKELYTTEEDIPSGDYNTRKSWLCLTNEGGWATFNIEDGILTVEIGSGGWQSWSVQILQAPITIEKNAEYLVELTAWASKPRDIEIKVGGTAGRGWTPYNPGPGGAGGRVITLGTERGTHEFTFVMMEETDTKARFEFCLGLDDGVVYLDEVAIYKVRYVSVDEYIQEVLDDIEAKEQADWQLVWSDEFDGPEIDTNIWSFEIGNGHANGIPGWGNEESQYYTDKPENARIDNGELVITAREETVYCEIAGKNFYFTSARMITQGKANMQYGKAEIRAKLPEGKGIWPALWMLGEKITEVGWPRCGEIDIMELVGHEPATVHATVHGPGYSGAGGIGNSYTLPEGKFSDDYHIFSIIWDKDWISWYVDGERYNVLARSIVEEFYQAEWVFDGDFFFIFNIAVGGLWPGYPDLTTEFPQEMRVDYIRLYKLPE